MKPIMMTSPENPHSHGPRNTVFLLFRALIDVIKEHGLGEGGWKSIRWEVYDKVRPILIIRPSLLASHCFLGSMQNILMAFHIAIMECGLMVQGVGLKADWHLRTSGTMR
jgi:hypothetical protein